MIAQSNNALIPSDLDRSSVFLQQNSRSHGSVPYSQRLSLPIVRGRLSGLWWSPAASGQLAPLWGNYEAAQCDAFANVLKSGCKILDVGAGCGFFSLLFARLVSADGQVVAIEQKRTSASVISFHASINHLTHLAVSATSIGGEAEVKHRRADATIDDFTKQLEFAPSHIRLSIGQDELPVLQGARRTIEQQRPTIFLSTRDSSDHHQCCGWLVDLGYQLRPLAGGNVSDSRHLVCTPQPKLAFEAA